MEHPIDEPPDGLIEIEIEEEDSESKRPGPLTILILLLLIVAMLSTLMWPLLRQSLHRYTAPPTPTPFFLQEA